jgi:hypothetical protein
MVNSFFMEKPFAPGTLSWAIGSSEDGSGKVQLRSLFKQQLKERLNETL